MSFTAQISYTLESRSGSPARKTVEVEAPTHEKLVEKVNKKMDKLAERAYCFDIRWST